MRLKWAPAAIGDLNRLHDFLAAKSPGAAIRTTRGLLDGPKSLLTHPRLGERVARYEPREVRTLWVGDYELHYELMDEVIMVLRIWHAREDR